MGLNHLMNRETRQAFMEQKCGSLSYIAPGKEFSTNFQNAKINR